MWVTTILLQAKEEKEHLMTLQLIKVPVLCKAFCAVDEEIYLEVKLT